MTHSDQVPSYIRHSVRARRPLESVFKTASHSREKKVNSAEDQAYFLVLKLTEFKRKLY